MAYRGDEAASRGLERARNYLIPRRASSVERKRAEEVLHNVMETCGPVVDAYPSWHPLLAQCEGQYPVQYPGEDCGYHGLDHTVYFAHGFITCPYHSGERVIDAVHKIKSMFCASIDAEEIDVNMYAEGAKTVLVRCDWFRPLEENHLIPKSFAVPLMLEKELPVWRWAQRSETWETMRPYLLGNPHGNRSSLFVGQETALAIKKIYLAMVESGMFGVMR